MEKIRGGVGSPHQKKKGDLSKLKTRQIWRMHPSKGGMKRGKRSRKMTFKESLEVPRSNSRSPTWGEKERPGGWGRTR